MLDAAKYVKENCEEDIKFALDVYKRQVFTGLRPGEKLYEELLMDEEGLQSTDNELIHIGKPIDFDEELFTHQLEELDELSRMDSPKIKEKVMEVVPTYHMQG